MPLYGGPEAGQVVRVDLGCDGVERLLLLCTSGNAQDPCPHYNGIPVQRLQRNPCHSRTSEQYLTFGIIAAHQVKNRDCAPSVWRRPNLTSAAAVCAVKRTGVMADITARDMAGLRGAAGLPRVA